MTPASTLESKYFERLSELQSRDGRAGVGQDEVEYLLRMVPLLREYTAEAENDRRSARSPHNTSKRKGAPTTQSDVQRLFSGGTVKKPGKKTTLPKITTSSIDTFVKVTKESRRGQLYYTYLSEFEPDNPELREWRVQPAPLQDQYTCPRCSAPMLHESSTATNVCTDCGLSVDYQPIDASGVTYEQERAMEHTGSFAYRRSNHFSEWLNQFQAVEVRVCLPPESVAYVRQNASTDTPLRLGTH